jgi:hypothetical protein
VHATCLPTNNVSGANIVVPSGKATFSEAPSVATVVYNAPSAEMKKMLLPRSSDDTNS